MFFELNKFSQRHVRNKLKTAPAGCRRRFNILSIKNGSEK